MRLVFFSKITGVGKAEGRDNEEAGNLGRRVGRISCEVMSTAEL